MSEIITTAPGGQLMETSGNYIGMAEKLADMKNKLQLVQMFFKEVMRRDEDYGVIPGTEKPTLLKPGAEKLLELYGFSPIVRDVIEEKDNETGFMRCRVIMQIIERRNGVIIAEGIGEANTYEGRYRFRWTPEWKMPQGVDHSTYLCETRKKRNGEEYLAYRLENDDPWTLWNTILKMAKKRALVDATLSATRSSGIFTQDVEDLKDWVEGDKPQTATQTNIGKSGKGQTYICQGEDCRGKNKTISKPVSEHSMAEFGKMLCMSCQDKYRKSKQPAQEIFSEANDLNNDIALRD